MKRKVIGVYRKCDFVTMSGTCFAISGIICAYNYHTTLAVFCLILAAICDAFDGVVARKFFSHKDEQIYGVELDSLSDAISFGVLPMLITLNLTVQNIYTYLISIFFVLCGVIRLAYFNMLSATKKGSHNEFLGVPITASAIVVPAIYFITFLVGKEYRYIIFPVTLLIMGLLYIIPFKLKKPTAREKIMLSIMGIIAIIVCIIKINL